MANLMLGGPPNLGNADQGAIIALLQTLHADNQAALARFQSTAMMPPGQGGGGGSMPPGGSGGAAVGVGGGGPIFNILGNPIMNMIGNMSIQLTGNITIGGGSGPGGGGEAGVDAATKAAEKASKKREEAEREREEGIKKLMLGIPMAAGSAFSRTSQGGEGEKTIDVIGGAIGNIASSKTTWDALLNVTKGIFDVASNLYSATLRRNQQVLDIAAGSHQFSRYAGNPGAVGKAKDILTNLESGDESLKYTAPERKEMAATLGTVSRQLPSFDVSNQEQVFASMRKLGEVSTFLGKGMTEFGGIVGEISRLTQQSFVKTAEQFQLAGAAIDSLGDNTRLSKVKFVDDVAAMTTALRSQRYVTEDSIRTVGKWAASLQDGTLSMGQLIQMIQGSRNADTGTMAFLAPKMMEFIKQNATKELGKEGGERFIRLLESQKSDVARAALLKGLSQGTDASALYDEAGLKFNRGQQKAGGNLGTRALDYSLRATSELIKGPDLGTNLIGREELYRVVGDKTGRSTSGFAYNEREKLRREGVLPGTGRGLRIQDEAGLPAKTISGQVGRDIVNNSNETIVAMKDATIGLSHIVSSGIYPTLLRIGEKLFSRNTDAKSTRDAMGASLNNGIQILAASNPVVSSLVNIARGIKTEADKP